MECKLTADEVVALKAKRIEQREKNWNKLFTRYDVEDDINDVVDWDDDDDDAITVSDDSGNEMEAAESDTEKEKENTDGSDAEEQKEFNDVFHKCAQQRIESVQEVYQKLWTEEKISKDGRCRTSKHESIVKQANKLTISSPRRSLAPKFMSHAIKGANEHQAINVGNNVGLELVPAVYNFNNNGPVGGGGGGGGTVATIDESIINSPLIQKNGHLYFEQTVTTTTITTTKIEVKNHPTHEAQGLDSIDVDDDDDDTDQPSPTKKFKLSQSTFSTPKSSHRRRRTVHETHSIVQHSTPKSTPRSTPSKLLSLEVATTTPKPLKGTKHSSRLAIMNTPQKVHVSGKDIQKSVKTKCPTIDTDRLKNRGDITISGRGESLVVECRTESTATSDILSRLKNETKPFIAKQIDTSF